MISRISNCWIGAIALASIAVLAGCGTPTPYQPVTDGQGYAEQALERDRYRVIFVGNDLTARETVENYLLYRAAEVTTANGYDHFVVVEKDTERNTIYHSTFSSFSGSTGRHGGGSAFHGFGSGISWPSDRYAAYANIVMRRGAKPADDPQAYDARAVLEWLAPTILRAPAS